jgi:hypothetical protein
MIKALLRLLKRRPTSSGLRNAHYLGVHIAAATHKAGRR